MIDLTSEQKLFIVQHLATFHTVAQVKKLVMDTYAVEVTPQVISAYNPATVAGGRLSQELKDAFEEARVAFQEDAADIAITHRNYRRRKLQDILDDPKAGKSPKVVVEIIRLYEQIEGGMFQQRVNGAKPDEVNDYVDRQMMKVRAAIAEAVPNPEEQQRVLDTVYAKL